MKIFGSFLILFFGYYAALACSCANTGDTGKDKAIVDSPIIFQGKVISIQSSWSSPADDHKVKFQVLRVWKGVETNEIIIETPSEPSACGYSFQEDSTYVVYAHGNPLFTNTCSMMAVDEERVRKVLGEGKNFENSLQPEGFTSWLWRKITSFFS